MAMHFNPRWDDPHQPHHPLVVRTHRHYGSWGAEERHAPSFPFSKGGNFEVLILNDNNEWKVSRAIASLFLLHFYHLILLQIP
jgi:hypothetical protein